MPRRPESSYLDDIRKAAELALSFVQGIDRKQFETALMCQSAVMRQLEIIGEAAKNISPTFRASHPEVPWKKMAGLRDILIHAYHDLDLDWIWETVQNDLAPLLFCIKPLLPP